MLVAMPGGAPVADHHQHLFSPAVAALIGERSGGLEPITGRDVVGLLDSAGIDRALVLSAAYMYGSPARQVADEHVRVREENDWTRAQASEYPGRLRAFCSVNPLRGYALDEIERCARVGFRGLKLHFGNSDVQLDRSDHVEQLRRVFGMANERGMAIVVHLRASISRQRQYGAEQARVFVDELLPLVREVPVQVAHLAGAGPGYDDPQADSAMAVLADAVEQHAPLTSQLWFDVATVVDLGISAPTADLVTRRIRQVGVDRIVYGSDAAVGGNLRPREGWAAFRQLPLTVEEISGIAGNVAPHLR